MRYLLLLLAFLATPAAAQTDWPIEEHDFVIDDFTFGTGETLDELRIHYATLGTPDRNAAGEIDNAVLLLHGTGGSGESFLRPQFADTLFGPDQALDIDRYFIILFDNIGHGGSSKPSDGMRTDFPRYDYADMVEAQRLLVEDLGISRLRLILGTSMGCMHGFIWGEEHPDMVQAMMPLACMPMEIAGQNRMWRFALMEGLRNDPGYDDGNYDEQPAMGMRNAANLLMVAGGAPLALQQEYPTREDAEAAYEESLAAIVEGRDANDMIWQFDSSRNYDPSDDLEAITMPVTWINSEDDFINPSNFGFAQDFADRMPQGRYVLIPETTETHGHGTHSWGAIWEDELRALLDRSE